MGKAAFGANDVDGSAWLSEFVYGHHGHIVLHLPGKNVLFEMCCSIDNFRKAFGKGPDIGQPGIAALLAAGDHLGLPAVPCVSRKLALTVIALPQPDFMGSELHGLFKEKAPAHGLAEGKRHDRQGGGSGNCLHVHKGKGGLALVRLLDSGPCHVSHAVHEAHLCAGTQAQDADKMFALLSLEHNVRASCGCRIPGSARSRVCCKVRGKESMDFAHDFSKNVLTNMAGLLLLKIAKKIKEGIWACPRPVAGAAPGRKYCHEGIFGI